MNAFTLAAPLQRHVERLAAGFLQPPGAPLVDFSLPPGEPALLAADSLSWVIFKNPLTMAIGGVAAVILELAEPHVRTGVWEHTSFRQSPLPRLQRTGLAAMMTVYGPRGQAEAMIARVNRLHGKVRGQTPQGQPYQADDPVLLTWVQATAAFGFIEAYGAYARALTGPQRDRLYAEGAVSGRLYGACDPPESAQAWETLLAAMQDRLAPSPIVFEFLDIMARAPLLPRGMRQAQRVLVNAAVALVPAWLRERLGLDDRWRLTAAQRRLVAWAARTADRLILHESPAVQACKRLGLPPSHLYGPRAWGS